MWFINLDMINKFLWLAFYLIAIPVAVCIVLAYMMAILGMFLNLIKAIVGE